MQSVGHWPDVLTDRSELKAGADAGVDNRNIYVCDRRKLNDLELAAQKHILRQCPIKSATRGEAPEQRVALPRAGRYGETSAFRC